MQPTGNRRLGEDDTSRRRRRRHRRWDEDGQWVEEHVNDGNYDGRYDGNYDEKGAQSVVHPRSQTARS